MEVGSTRVTCPESNSSLTGSLAKGFCEEFGENLLN